MKYIRLACFIVGVTILVASIIFSKINSNLRHNLDTTTANLKAALNNQNTLKDENRVLQLNYSQLQYFNDSILNRMDSIRKVLKLKSKDVKSIQYIKSTIHKTDTIHFKDTIFMNSINIDTTITDKWSNINIKMYYPNTIMVSPSFVSEKYITVSSKKETVNPPKKFFLFRWFQRKHKVLIVNIHEENPYIETNNSKFVEILK